MSHILFYKSRDQEMQIGAEALKRLHAIYRKRGEVRVAPYIKVMTIRCVCVVFGTEVWLYQREYWAQGSYTPQRCAAIARALEKAIKGKERPKRAKPSGPVKPLADVEELM